MATASTPNLNDELVLVERVFLRICSAATDDALEAELHKFLAPVILKLASPHEPVRKKVMELLIHVNRRVKAQEHIQLPVEALLTQYQDPSATSFVTNFSIIYIRMGYPRLDINKQVELLTSMLQCLSGKPAQHQDSLLLLIIPVLGHVKQPESPEKAASLLGLRDNPQISKLLLDFMVDVLLMSYGATPLAQQQRPAEGAQESSSGSSVAGVPAGMSASGFKRVMGDSPPKPEQLEQMKLAIVKFLSTGVLLPSTIVIPLIIAAADTRFAVANAADLQIRRNDSTVDWNSSGVISSLYLMFLGTLTPRERTPTDKFKNPANTRIRLKLMPLLLKSREAANYTPLAVKVFFECLWGQNSNSKLKQQGVMFLHHVAFNAETEKLSPVGSVLFSGTVKVIEEEMSDPKLRSLAYGALAKLSLKIPNLLLSHASQLHYLQTLMTALTQEQGDVLLAVQEALSMVAPVCKQLSLESQNQLCILLTEHVLHHNAQLRRTAVHYASSVFPYDHIPSRFILMIAAGDDHDDIRIEARRQLYKAVGERKDGTPEHITPNFSDMICYVLERINSLPKTRWHESGNQPIPFSLVVMEQILRYHEHCLSIEAGDKRKDEDQLMWIDPPAVGHLIRNIVEKHERDINSGNVKRSPSPVMRYIGIAELAADAWCPYGLEAILRVVAVAPEVLISYYSDKIDWIKKFVFRGGYSGEIAAHLFGVVVGHLPLKHFDKLVTPLTKLKDMRVESQESSVLALGYSFGYSINTMRRSGVVLEDWPLFETAVHLLLTQLAMDNNPIQNNLVRAIGDMARQSPLPLEEGSEEDKKPSFHSLVKNLETIKNNNKLPSKVREVAIATLGYLSVGQADFPLRKRVLESMFLQGKETNEIEIHFAIGESLVDTALGTDSPSSRNFWTEENPLEKEPQENQDVKEDKFEEREKDSDEAMEKDQPKESIDQSLDKDVEKMEVEESSSVQETSESNMLSWLLSELFSKYVQQTQPSIRQATCIWLLAILKHCKRKPEVQQRLTTFQSTFMNYLADHNDFVQDAASKGLGLVYECCSEAKRQAMVEGLVFSLTEGKRTFKNLTQDTKIAMEGELGTTPSGGQITTYRELCSLATDLNQPDLVYKFMHLASPNAIWNSRKGAAFGFSTLASQAGTQLEPYLPQIVPRLYRYQHDPVPRIQQPMASIWNALVKDSTKTIEKYYDPILNDLITNLTNTLWRVRESSCHALNDLIRRQPIVNALPRLHEMWVTLFRVRDDIKESVRLAADKTLQSLSKSCIRVCEGIGQESEKTLQVVLPVLLTSGISSEVAEVRSISLQTVVKLCRSGGAMVRPHLGTLVPALLEALSGLESQSLSYTSVRLDDSDREKLDIARVAAAKGTPMMDTLNCVLQYVDEGVLEEVVVRVIDILKGSIGLNSKAGAAHVVESLTHHCPGPLEKFSGKILSALLNGLNDRNTVIRKVYANAIGSVIKTSKSSSIEKLLNKLKTWYMEKDDDDVRYSAALALRSMHNQNSDVMKQHAAQALPLVFLGMHAKKAKDNDPHGAEVWEEIWSENTPGTEAGVRLYLVEILAIAELALQSSNWDMKAQGARALSTVSEKLGTSLSNSQVSALITLLLTGLHGRTWTGKGALVTALSNVCVHTKSTLPDLKQTETNSNLLDDVVAVLIREASKEKMEYKIDAFKALSTVLHTYGIDRFEQVFEICIPYVTQKPADGAEEEERNKKEEELRWNLIDEMVHSLGKAWPTTIQTQERYSEQVLELLSNNVSCVPRKTQLSIIKALQHFWQRHFLITDIKEATNSPLLNPLLHHTCRIFNYCLKSEVILGKLRSELLSGVEEARRDAQPDIKALATTAHRILLLQ
ncbi:proteasome adapter and scaffold protein ECM29-like isoform X2 [Oratosquilla oratoria]|uniref:proteasome adapter and scaffold protein ECM29-like isoform X2 n=1 Tax=Oratosquilla oratoria TaxID=337810 RepID=UPI003F772925